MGWETLQGAPSSLCPLVGPSWDALEAVKVRHRLPNRMKARQAACALLAADPFQSRVGRSRTAYDSRSVEWHYLVVAGPVTLLGRPMLALAASEPEKGTCDATALVG